MGPALHATCSVAEAVSAFGDGPGEPFCDGQFVVLPGAVLAFVTVGESATESDVPSPSLVRWRPRRLDYDPTDREHPWLPEPVRNVFRRGGGTVERIRDHHVFVRASEDRSFVHAGRAHLGSYGGGRGDFSAEFTLDEKLPRDLWLRLGGYAGWLIEVDHDPVRVDAGDVPAFLGVLARLEHREFAHLSLTRYEEDEFSVYANRDRGWLMYLPTPGDPGLYVRDPAGTGDPRAQERFLCPCGIDLDVPLDHTLPRAQALRAADDFFRIGALPGWLAWGPG